MASTCESIFADSRLKQLNLRYFDPTLSAAAGHEDKGLIECLMVKCAKKLLNFAETSAHSPDFARELPGFLSEDAYRQV
jgi:hypothetical protein